MWSDQQAELRSRQARLLVHSRALRHRLAEETQALGRPLALADKAHAGVDWLLAHPQWLAAIVALPVLLRPRRALGWALKLWWGWGAWRKLRQLLA